MTRHQDAPVPPDVYTAAYYLNDRVGSAEFVKSRGRTLCAQHARALALAALRPGARVLDVGCGCGELAIHAALAGADATGIDYASSAIALAREALRQFPAEVQARVQLVVAPAETMPLLEGQRAQFDCVFLMDVIEHLHPWQIQQLYQRLTQLLKPGGKIICHTYPNRWHTVYLYPLVYYASRLVGIRKPRSPRLEHDEAMHVNEQSIYSVWRALSRAGLRTRVWMEHDSPVGGHAATRWLYRCLHEIMPFACFFADDIWAVGEKR